jgi:hypothetical protein
MLRYKKEETEKSPCCLDLYSIWGSFDAAVTSLDQTAGVRFEEVTKSLNQDIRFLGWDLNTGSPELQTGVLTDTSATSCLFTRKTCIITIRGVWL